MHQSPTPVPCASCADIKGELGRLNTELMFVFSELLRVMVENPASYPSPLNTLNQLFSNMQHLVNMLRPIQVGIHRQACLADLLLFYLPLIWFLRVQKPASRKVEIIHLSCDLVRRLVPALSMCCNWKSRTRGRRSQA